MSSVALSGADTIVINNRIFADFADGNCVELTFPNDISNVKKGKNGNAIYGLNEQGTVCELKIRLLRASSDDKYMLGLLAQQRNDFSAFVLMIGQFVKKVGDGAGNIASDTYDLAGGIFKKNIDAKMNVEGETDQSVSLYTIDFSQAVRTIG